MDKALEVAERLRRLAAGISQYGVMGLRPVMLEAADLLEASSALPATVERLRAETQHGDQPADNLLDEAADRIEALERRLATAYRVKAECNDEANWQRHECARLAAENEKLRAALEIIRLRDWRWRGGGSERRIQCKFGRMAAAALNVPVGLADGWPTVNGDAARLEQAVRARAALSGGKDGE